MRRVDSIRFCRDSLIAAQIDVLNEDYSGSGIQFELAGTDRTVNSNWFNNAGPDTLVLSSLTFVIIII